MARKQYPSDHRRWLRLYEDVLDDPKLNALTLEDQALYFRLLATLNRQKSRDGHGTLDRFAVCAIAKSERWPYSLRGFLDLQAGGLVRVRCGCGEPLVRLRCDECTGCGAIVFTVPKWPELQGFAPAELRRDSGRTPAPTPTPTHTPILTPSESGEAPLAHTSDRLLNLLGKEPGSPEEKRAWLERELPLLEAKAEAEHPGSGAEAKRARNARMRSLLMTHWRNREVYPQDRTQARAGPQTFTERRVENTRRAAQEAFGSLASRRGLLPEGTHGP